MSHMIDTSKAFALSLAASGMLAINGGSGASAADEQHHAAVERSLSDFNRSGRVDFEDLEAALTSLRFDNSDDSGIGRLLDVLSDWGTTPFPASGDEFVAGLRNDQIVDLGDGRFQIALDPEIGTETPPWLNGAIEWEYAGQAVYQRDADESYERLDISDFDDDEATDTVTRVLKTEMHDIDGRLFRVKSVDRERLDAAIASYEARAKQHFGFVEEATEDDGSALDPDPRGGTNTLHTWFFRDQDGNGEDDLARWNSDSRTMITGSPTERQDKTVIYFGSNGQCSGVLVGDRWVLTAAHCLKSLDGVWNAWLGQVCTRGAGVYSGSECAAVTRAWGNGSWAGGDRDHGDDIVILKIDNDLGRDNNYMLLSSASNSRLKDHKAYNVGYPGLHPNGTGNSGWMYWSKDDVNYTSTKIIGTKVDSSEGHSGGPIYYYPNGVAEGSHLLTGIMSGFHRGPFKSWNGGPKMPYHRDWILGIIE